MTINRTPVLTRMSIYQIEEVTRYREIRHLHNFKKKGMARDMFCLGNNIKNFDKGRKVCDEELAC